LAGASAAAEAALEAASAADEAAEAALEAAAAAASAAGAGVVAVASTAGAAGADDQQGFFHGFSLINSKVRTALLR
jgi:hypothetical protein